jgi:hypothetical protein
VASSFSWSCAFGGFLWGYVKDQVYNHRVNMLDKLKPRVTVAIANVTKDMLAAGIT